MSQYTLNGCPVALGSIQYSPFSFAWVSFRMFSQEIAGNSGNKPSPTEREEEKDLRLCNPLPVSLEMKEGLRHRQTEREMSRQTDSKMDK